MEFTGVSKVCNASIGGGKRSTPFAGQTRCPMLLTFQKGKTIWGKTIKKPYLSLTLLS
jgi:hypothetical protein